MTKLVLVCCVFVAAPLSNAQTISRVLNAASLDTRLAPGCLATVAGTNLGTATSTGTGIVLGTHADGGAISHNCPAALGETASIFATGLGPTVPPLATGAGGPENPPAATAVP